ncbi:PH domain-containing protein [Nocardioides sp. CFH 31398]|uniref:PH domain-containing protein n=1 Tax=Nocardioides sp. CFH 31398 TaxID=2919579 RepID=UPI001F069DAF|nr:PH domain-containing protein [Nocardioides sp. CFH 31398]MCH1868556.1 PH domain-containing protein [Nocardioides sp. CFH 31398]MCH1868973.1 PH domain-containing protein [Nocardioides sp. CFH 31398]
MPAASERGLPRTFRPLATRMAATLLGGMLLVICLAAWFLLARDIRDRFTPFQIGTMLFFGLLLFSVWWGLVRSRITVTAERLVVVNGFRRHDYDQAQVLAVRLPSGAPWATLDLADGTTRTALGIQSSDGDRARAQLRELRALLER